MKTLVIVFSFLVLVLNCVPCCAFEECVDEVASEQTGHQEDSCDNCSPFVSCGTCQGFVVQYEVPKVDSFLKVYQMSTFGCEDTSYSKYTSSIWQPPQLIS